MGKNQRLGAADVGGRHVEIERYWTLVVRQITESASHSVMSLGNDRVAVEAKKAHRRREHAGALFLRLVEQFSRRRLAPQD